MIDAKDHLGTYRGGGTATTCTHCGEPITVGRLCNPRSRARCPAIAIALEQALTAATSRYLG